MMHPISLALALLLIGFPGAAFAQSAPPPAPPPAQSLVNDLQAVDWAQLPGGRVVIRLRFQNPLDTPPGVITTYHPSRNIAFDFANTRNTLGKVQISVSHRAVRTIDVVQAGTRTRLVVNLNAPLVHESEMKGRELFITLRHP